MDLEPDMVAGSRYVRRMVEGLHRTWSVSSKRAGLGH